MPLVLFHLALSSLIVSVILAYVVACLGIALYNIYVHPLKKFPGPVSRAAISLPGILELWNGTTVKNVAALHKKYGSVVRIAPDALSFTSSQAWKGKWTLYQIYGFRQGRKQIPKDYKRFPDVPDALPILASNDVDHARMRKLMAHAFSETALREQEPLLTQHVNELVDELGIRADSASVDKIDMNEWYNLIAFDVVSDLSFGESFGAVKAGTRHRYIEDFFMSAQLFPIIPTAWEYALAGFALKLLMQIPSFKAKHEAGYMATKTKVRRRMASVSTDRRDFMTYIMRYNDDRGMSEAEIVGCTAVLVNAGGDATAACMSAATFYMLSNLAVLEKARAEVRGSFKRREDIRLRSTATLTYLNAVIDEALRIYPPTPGIFARRTGLEGDTVDGAYIPPNTSLGVHAWSATHSSSNFSSPFKFAPERWLPDPPAEYRHDDKAASQPWSLGPRSCLGRNLAYFEIRSTLAHMLWEFDMELCAESREWAERQRYEIIWHRPPLYVKLSRRTSS